MIFETQNGLVRPIRLSEETRQFAYDSLHRKYGLDTLRVMEVNLDDVENYGEMTPLQRYDLAIRRIVTEAPVRICEGERISGAATLGRAIHHQVPAVREGAALCSSVSHLTVDFATVLSEGIDGIRRRAEAALEQWKGTEREAFCRSALTSLDSFDLWYARYLEALREDPRYRENYENLTHVPHQPPTSFYEAVQSIWFVFAFLRLCGNWPGIGRIDWLLGDYLKRDLAAGILTLDEAREILAHFFIKGCEWVNGQFVGSGDAQHYQNIVLAGVDPDGHEVTNEVTYLVLEILEELGISDFPTTVRLSARSDERLVRRVAEVMRYGGGILAIYNEDLIIDAMVKYGYDLREARQFANDGCWEVQVPGKTYFMYSPFDGLQILQQETLSSYAEDVDYPDFESLYAAYLRDLQKKVGEIEARRALRVSPCGVPGGDWHWKPDTPCTLVSLFEAGCIESGRSYFEGGPLYQVLSPHIGGLADVVNSLYAIQKLAYEEKQRTLPELLSILRGDWEGEEALQQYVKSHYDYYGNDNEEVDALMARLIADFAAICDAQNGKTPVIYPAGVSTFGRQLGWAGARLATPFGRRAHEVLAANASPTPGTDHAGATALIRSYCRADWSALPVGAALDLRLLPSSVEGESGLAALMGLLRGFVALGGFFLQPDVADAAILREAQAHPENYTTLSVRVSGWNARFVTLNRQWQDMVIAQNEK